MDFETHMHIARCAKKNGNQLRLRIRRWVDGKLIEMQPTPVYVLQIDRHLGAALVSRIAQDVKASTFWVYVDRLFPKDYLRV